MIAKIEKPQAAERAEEIIKAATAGIMVARGDLGIELPIEQVPERPEAAARARRALLAGPRSPRPRCSPRWSASPRPTRAEVTDVANAIYDGTDAVMLSEETAVGEHPVEAVRVMDRIARETEPDLPYGDWVFNRVRADSADVASSVARAAVASTYTLGTWRRSSSRPAAAAPRASSPPTARRVPVLAVSPRLATVRRLNLLFGVRCAIADEWTSLRELLDDCARLAKQTGVAHSGDLIAITAGLPSQELGTNLFEVHRVP